MLLIFINDIADDMLGLCRLFADDTPVGERSLEINNLRSMVNIDLYKYYALGETVANRTKPRKKKEIVYFSTRLYSLELYFSIDNVKIKTANAHKHLGVTFSAACKWSKHINNVVVKQANNYDLRNANNFTIPRCCLTLFKDSFFQPLFISGIIYPNISEIHLATAFQNLD